MNTTYYSFHVFLHHLSTRIIHRLPYNESQHDLVEYCIMNILHIFKIVSAFTLSLVVHFWTQKKANKKRKLGMVGGVPKRAW
jgi:hypothetical protein